MVLETPAKAKPLLLVLDDLQWADAGSINLLFHLGRRLEGCRILIIAIYRPADVALGRDGERHPLEPVINEFMRHFGQVHIDLRQTNDRDFVEDFLDTEPNRLGAEFRRALYRQTKGHALFTIEMLRGMQERGDLVRDETGRWVEGLAVDWQALPARVEGIIEERIGRLPIRLQEALNAVSVEGELLLGQDADATEVERYFHKAINIARRQQAKSLELRAVMSLCKLRQAQGQKVKARRMLAEIYDWFGEGFDTTDLKNAGAMLRELS